MRTRFPYRLIVALCVLATVTATGGLGAVVICVGSDGHSGIERLLDQCCIPSGGPGQTSGLNLAASRHVCGDCVDVIVVIPPLTPRTVHFDAPLSTDVECPAGENFCRFLSVAHGSHAEITTPSLSLGLLSSVILLT